MHAALPMPDRESQEGQRTIGRPANYWTVAPVAALVMATTCRNLMMNIYSASMTIYVRTHIQGLFHAATLCSAHVSCLVPNTQPCH